MGVTCIGDTERGGAGALPRGGRGPHLAPLFGHGAGGASVALPAAEPRGGRPASDGTSTRVEDEDIVTTWREDAKGAASAPTATVADPQDADGTDGDGTDGEDRRRRAATPTAATATAVDGDGADGTDGDSVDQ